MNKYERYWRDEIPTVTEEAEMLLQNVVETEQNLLAGLRDPFVKALHEAIYRDIDEINERIDRFRAERWPLLTIQDAYRQRDSMRLHLDIIDGYAEAVGRHMRVREPWTLRSVDLLKPIIRGIAALHGISEAP